MVGIDTLLASTGGGLDQSANTGNRTQFSYVCHAYLNGSRGIIFVGGYRV